MLNNIDHIMNIFLLCIVRFCINDLFHSDKTGTNHIIRDIQSTTHIFTNSSSCHISQIWIVCTVFITDFHHLITIGFDLSIKLIDLFLAGSHLNDIISTMHSAIDFLLLLTQVIDFICIFFCFCKILINITQIIICCIIFIKLFLITLSKFCRISCHNCFICKINKRTKNLDNLSITEFCFNSIKAIANLQQTSTDTIDKAIAEI